MRTSRLWMTVGLLAGALASAAACTSFSSEGTPPSGDVDAGVAPVVPEGSTSDGGERDAASATDAPADGRCAVTVSTDFSTGYGAAWSTPTNVCATGGATFATAGGVTCLDLTCSGGLDAYNIIVSNPLVLDDRMEIAFDARIDGSFPHTFAQLLSAFGSGSNLGFATAGTEIHAYDSAPLAFWTWSPNDPGFHHFLIQITRIADDAGPPSALFSITLDGTLREFKHALNVSTNVQFQLGPFLHFGASTTAADDCYTNVTFGSCH
jgi:hypothetical protein